MGSSPFPLAFTTSKQSHFCFTEMIMFPGSPLNGTFKVVFFFYSFHLKHHSLPSPPPRRSGGWREEKTYKTITKC